MRVAVGSDERSGMTDAVLAYLAERGFECVAFGALTQGESSDWPDVGRNVARAVASGTCTSGIVCCWTGTGVAIAANKISGVRAALCADAQTAAGAREWNDANVLALSLRATTPAVAREILDAWFGGRPTDDRRCRSMIEIVEGPIQARH